MPKTVSWPRQPPTLTPEQQSAREEFMGLWLKELPNKYGIIERFNHGALAQLPAGRAHWRTLEIGAGLGAHARFEDLSKQEYHCLEVRSDFCDAMRALPGIAGVTCADIERPTPFEAGSFDRIIAIHMLEHLRNLPAALIEIDRLLADDGVFDVVLPCEGSFAYSLARRISAKPMFERRFGISYDPIIANEHVNTLSDVLGALARHFAPLQTKRFPIGLPIDALNLCIALRLRKVSPSPKPSESAPAP